MKAILATQVLIDKNAEFFSGVAVDSIVKKNIPDKFNGEENINAGGYRNRTDLHILDGWKDVVIPSYNTQTQKLGGLVLDVDVYTYEVIDLTQEEINANIIAQSEGEKQQLIEQKLAEQVVSEAQVADDTTALDNQVLFPFWQPDQTYTLNEKCQYIVGNEIWLFKINQPTLVTSALNPPNSAGSEALYSRVAYPDEILAWVQPTSSINAYNTGDKVYYVNVGDQIWISKIDANTTVPDGDEPFNRYWEPYNG